MSIQSYIREIGRGKDGAKSLSKEQAFELMGMILDDELSDIQLGAFCIAMRIKGETEQEMAGFLDAAHQRLNYFTPPKSNKPTIVIPSYNGARRLPVLTPLLGLLLAREGFAVLMHGSSTENTRVSSQEVLEELGVNPTTTPGELKAGELAFAPTSIISASLLRLLEIRRTIGLRNSAHSMVKLIQPVQFHNDQETSTTSSGLKPLLITSYTHPEYAISMKKTLELVHGDAVLLRGCEGEAVADPRRSPAYTVLKGGIVTHQQDSEKGSVSSADLFTEELNAKSIAYYTSNILNGKLPTPKSILDQIELIKSTFKMH